MSLQSIEQQRAKFALEWVEKINANSQMVHSEWKARANEMPAMIQMNGLGQTLAFYCSKNKSEAHQQMYQFLQAWLCKERQLLTGQNLMKALTACDMAQYRAAQAETQAILLWLKKFSRAYC